MDDKLRKGKIAMTIGKKLVILFLLVSLVPAALISVSNFLQSSDILEKEEYAKLEAVRAIKGHQIEDYFKERLADARMYSSLPKVVQAVQDFGKAFHAEGFQGVAYREAAEKLGAILINIKRIYGYYDVMLLDTDGDVVYTVEKEWDLGENLMRGKLLDTNLAEGFRNREKGIQLIDFKIYPPSNGPASFVVAELLDLAGLDVGALAFQIPIADVNEIMQERTGLGETGETYLVGADRLMRSDSRFEHESTIFRKRIDTAVVTAALEGTTGDRINKDYRGTPVLTAFAPLKVPGLKWVVLAEIDAAEAFADIATLRNQAAAIGGLMALVVTFLALFFARNLSRPITRIALVGERLAKGDVNQPKLNLTSADEVGVLGRVFDQLIDYLTEKAEAARQIATGNLAIQAKSRGEQDQLGNSFVSMLGYLQNIGDGSDRIAKGDLSVEIVPTGKEDQLGTSLRQMVLSLRQSHQETTDQDWLKSGLARLNDVVRGELQLSDLVTKTLSEVSTNLDAKVGAFYTTKAQESGEQSLSLLGSYAYTQRKNLSHQFGFGEGLVGQAALEHKQILISNAPEDYIKVCSGLGEAVPRHICVTPLLFKDDVKGVIEVATLDALTELKLDYLRQAANVVATTVELTQGRMRIASALEEAQRMSEELQAQQEELTATNSELEEQTQSLQRSEEQLKTQQEELEAANGELEEKNELLEQQKREVEQARREITERAEELALASKYKSEFLANMSHELRTPLNSLLLLARQFVDNKSGNLSGQQIESAKIIHGSGNDLLALINEILDLSKIEAGRMDIKISRLEIADLAQNIKGTFEHLTGEKGLGLDVVVSEDCPDHIFTDHYRLQQVVKNLVSNAIKFTSEGSVSIAFRRPASSTNLAKSGLSPQEALGIEVRDTGIGIAPDKHRIIFEAFQQADAGTTRKFGGTGLGLTISREITSLLGGEIQVASELGHGSTFTVFLPLSKGVEADVGPRAQPAKPAIQSISPQRVDSRPARAVEQVADDRIAIGAAEKVILIIEDDHNFARILLGLCHEKDFKCLVAGSGEDGLVLAKKHMPAAIILDIQLPGKDGWKVLELLKEDPETRHIPVHIASVEEPSLDSFKKGAIGHLRKPVSKEDLEGTFERIENLASRRVKELLVVEDDAEVRRSIVELVGEGDVHTTEATNGAQAIAALKSGLFDCMILDLGLWDIDGKDLLKSVGADPSIRLPPVIIYTARDLTVDEEVELRTYAESIIIKDVRSQDRLLDEVSLFLHRVVKDLPQKKRQVITDLHNTDIMFQDKTVLIVDDDMRTVFAMSKLLVDRGMKTLKADNGEKALKALEQEPRVDIVLMDIMMPVMDGYEAIKRIREQERFRRTPIIALTAKAMKGDSERCVVAGANDYLPKPVDQDRLLSLMRVWLYR